MSLLSLWSRTHYFTGHQPQDFNHVSVYKEMTPICILEPDNHWGVMTLACRFVGWVKLEGMQH